MNLKDANLHKILSSLKFSKIYTFNILINLNYFMKIYFIKIFLCVRLKYEIILV